MSHVILVVAAHPDDEILGVGGTVRRLVDEGAQAYALILGEGATSRLDSRASTDSSTLQELHADTLSAAKQVGYSDVFFANLPDNRFDSVDLLDVIKIVERYVKEIAPVQVYTHHHGDLNIDHRVTCEAVATATRPLNNCPVRDVLCFETLSSTEWAFPTGLSVFRPNQFVNIRQKGLQAKLAAMRCYRSELAEFPHPRSLKALEAAATKWGSVVGFEAVEAFEVLRRVIA